MINIIITSYGEPKSTARAIDCFLNQDIKEEFQITIIDPFPETEEFLNKKYKNKIDFFLDPGEGKSYALNIFLERIYSQNKEDIIILTDGDVYVSKNTVDEIIKAFKDKQISCITGRPISINSKKNMFGYWFKVLFDGIHKVRKKLSDKRLFFECSGYLFAIRNNVLKGFPLETSEDSIIPYLFWEKGYKIKYLPKAEVYVLNPQNWKDYKTQKIRNIKGHENLNKIAPNIPRTKSFFNEIKEGLLFTLAYPKSFKELIWTFDFIFTRLYIYLIAFYELKFKKKRYEDGWRKQETKSTRSLD
jgi:cellulose synthase/poly-beta-1,6-N-acetylglucosamine synthase-like glycosyltransferase